MKNNPKLKSRRRELRARETRAEQILWLNIRNRGLDGHRFVRQFGVGPYILDFYCPALQLAIELDGLMHEVKEERAYDQNRDAYLHEAGIKVMRFKNFEVTDNLKVVLEAIHLSCHTREVQLKAG